LCSDRRSRPVTDGRSHSANPPSTETRLISVPINDEQKSLRLPLIHTTAPDTHSVPTPMDVDDQSSMAIAPGFNKQQRFVAHMYIHIFVLIKPNKKTVKKSHQV